MPDPAGGRLGRRSRHIESGVGCALKREMDTPLPLAHWPRLQQYAF